MEGFDMIALWVKTLISGRRIFNDVPERYKAKIKSILDEKLKNGEIEQYTYDAIFAAE